MTQPAALYDDIATAETQAATAYLEATRDRVAVDGTAVRATHLSGDIAAMLLDYERDAGIDLVVLCSHGRSGLARFALGSIATRLLHHGAAPLLLVRSFGVPVALDQAVVPLDGSARAERALAIVEQMAGQVIRAVTLVRVISAPEDGPEAERYLAEAGGRLPRSLAFTCRVELGDPANTILEVAGRTSSWSWPPMDARPRRAGRWDR